MVHIAELFTRKNSGEIARKRLKLLLISDRADCSPQLLEMIRSDFLRSISRYLDVRDDELRMCVIRTPAAPVTDRLPAICAAIPVLDVRSHLQNDIQLPN
mgnify:FL=1